jgi:4-hydroxybenzoate polyprenyltransferase
MELLKKLYASFRAHEWWSYKIPPVLAIGYATVWLSGGQLWDYLPNFGVFLVAATLAAIYVSTINDYFDISIDLAAGKKNRLASWTPAARLMWIAVIFLLAAVMVYFFIPRDWSLFSYVMIGLVFTLYSMPPFRLKERALWGVLCDALGAHGFATLFLVAYISSIADIPSWTAWWWSVWIWAICVGLRGILWHQYSDRMHDLATKTQTLAVKIPPAQFITWEVIIAVIEIVSLAFLLSYLNHYFVYVGLIGYFILVWLRFKLYGQFPIWIINHRNRGNQVWMIDYYQVILPWTILGVAISQNPQNAWIALIHFLLFPTKVLAIGKDVFYFLRKITKAQ